MQLNSGYIAIVDDDSSGHVHSSFEGDSSDTDINATLTIKGLPRDTEEEIVNYSDKNRSIRTRDRSTAEIKIIDETLGSLIIWTKISVAVFKSKDLFLRALKEFLDKTFSYFQLENGNDIDITVTIEIDEEELNVNDMDDFFRCGICSKELYALAAFEYHKRKSVIEGLQETTRIFHCRQKSKSQKTKENNAQRGKNRITDTSNRESNAANSRHNLPKVTSLIQPLGNPRLQMYQHADTEVDTSTRSFNDQLPSMQHIAGFEDNVTCEESDKSMVSHATSDTDNKNIQQTELQSENYVQRRADEKFSSAQHTQVEEYDSSDDKCDVNITNVNVNDVLKFLIRTFCGGCSFKEFMRRSDTDNARVSGVDHLFGFKERQSHISLRDDTKRSPFSQDGLAIEESFTSSNNDELSKHLAIALSLDDYSYDSMIGLDAGIWTIGDEKETKKLHHRFNMTEKIKNILQSNISDFLDLPGTETKSHQSDSTDDNECPSSSLIQKPT
ncbi:unnamed protein product [Mytilus edulis]|uniref:Uncharacterized protein n=1 Tax=Mytilus edulis TaxID=6550 RepID=A0A8S3SKJ6_MYTED|nr:unnamed protein product [Mytilus edulis]